MCWMYQKEKNRTFCRQLVTSGDDGTGTSPPSPLRPELVEGVERGDFDAEGGEVGVR